MAWVSTDKEKIRRHLSIPATAMALEKLLFLMDSAAADQITSAQTAIGKLDLLLTSFETKAGEDLALIKADVLEWETGSPEAKLTGIRSQQSYWRDQLSLALAYDGRFSSASGIGEQAVLLRS